MKKLLLLAASFSATLTVFVIAGLDTFSPVTAIAENTEEIDYSRIDEYNEILTSRNFHPPKPAVAEEGSSEELTSRYKNILMQGNEDLYYTINEDFELTMMPDAVPTPEELYPYPMHYTTLTFQLHNKSSRKVNYRLSNFRVNAIDTRMGMVDQNYLFPSDNATITMPLYLQTRNVGKIDFILEIRDAETDKLYVDTRILVSSSKMENARELY